MKIKYNCIIIYINDLYRSIGNIDPTHTKHTNPLHISVNRYNWIKFQIK